MIAVKGNNSLHRRIYFGIVSAMLFLSAASTGLSATEAMATAGDTDKIRISRSLRNPERNREEYSKLEKSDDSYKALSLSGTRSSPSGQ